MKRYFAQHNLTWGQFVVGAGVHWAHAVGNIEEIEVEHISLGLVKGRGEESEEV